MSEKLNILVVEDEPNLRDALCLAIECAGHRVIGAADGPQALRMLERNTGEHALNLVITDLKMQPMDGLTLLREIRAREPVLPVLLMTAFGDVEKAVAAMRAGACDFLLKPFEPDVLLAHIDRYAAPVVAPTDMVAEDARTRQVLGLASRVAKSEATVLLTGESGTGKEVFARYIHQQSARAGKPFIAINCAAIPDNLLESELFGYEKGAFTGATKQTPGKIEVANKGTLFLDEIGDLPGPLQAKLLRFLQERVIERLGGRDEIPIDVRVVCATHQNLQTLIGEGRFREDLYYRLAEIVVTIPPLREREGDAALLAHSFVKRFAGEQGRSSMSLSREAVAAIEAHKWPGNVRELENCIKRATIMADGNQIMVPDLGLKPAEENGSFFNLRQIREEAERKAVVSVLARVDGNMVKAAEMLGVSRPTLYDLMNRFGLR
jgi:putative PEP-CTERM system response regulator